MSSTSVSGSPPGARRRLLVVDDEAENIELLSRTFHSKFEIHQAKDGKEALSIARQIRPAVIITDQRMPEMTGVEFLEQIKEELPQTIRILITGYTDYESLVNAVNVAGIDRYFEKPFHTVDLRTVVDALLHSADLETEREKLVEQVEGANVQLAESEQHLRHLVKDRTHELEEANRLLKELAARDPLTGLFNRRSLEEHIRIEVARSYRYKRVFCVLFLDIDNFKQVNDSFGHATGDAVLCRLAQLLVETTGQGLRRSDFVARYGGEEFCLILPETDLHGGETKPGREMAQATLAEMLVTLAEAMLKFPLSGSAAALTEHCFNACFPGAGKEIGLEERPPMDDWTARYYMTEQRDDLRDREREKWRPPKVEKEKVAA